MYCSDIVAIDIPSLDLAHAHKHIHAPPHPHAKAVEKGLANVPAAPRATCMDLTACEDEKWDCIKIPGTGIYEKVLRSPRP